MIYVISLYFIIGGIATAVINNRKPAESKARWIKYLVYVAIVFTMLGTIEFRQFLLVATIITAVGFYEIVRVGRGMSMWAAVAVYSLIAITFLYFAQQKDQERQFLLYVTILTFDGFSQIAGQLFGKTKLAPNISPNKTAEGMAGGLLISVATAYFFWNAIIPGIIICTAGLAGDLLASFYKRKCGVKDYSNLIPGHGGILDRFDSLIFAGAVCALIC